MNLEKRKFFCDIDGVLADTQVEALKEAQEQFGMYDFKFDDWSSFDTLTRAVMWMNPRVKEVEVNDILFGNDVLVRAKPAIGAREAIAELSEVYDVRTVTSRPPSQQLITQEWIRDNFGDHIKNVYIRNHFHDQLRGIDFKIRVLAREGAAVHIDDDVKVVNLLKQMGGIRPMIMDQPWNRDWNNTMLPVERTDWKNLPYKVINS